MKSTFLFALVCMVYTYVHAQENPVQANIDETAEFQLNWETPDAIAFTSCEMQEGNSRNTRYNGCATAVVNGQKKFHYPNVYYYPELNKIDISLYQFNDFGSPVEQLLLQKFDAAPGSFTLGETIYCNATYYYLREEGCTASGSYHFESNREDNSHNVLKIIDFNPVTRIVKARFRCMLKYDFDLHNNMFEVRDLQFEDGIIIAKLINDF